MMRKSTRRSFFLSLSALALVGCAASTSRPEGDIDARDMDVTADPTVDFYRYVNGGWLDRTEIPEEKSSWSLASEVFAHNQDVLLEILEEAGDESRERDDLTQKLGDFWACGMDVDAIEAAGATPLAGVLAQIDAIDDRASFAAAIAELHSLGVGVCFSFGSGQDLKDPTAVIAWAAQDGLGLPDRDYYMRDDETSIELREQYVAHIAKMLTLLGTADAERDAQIVMAIETRLAKPSLSSVALRNPQNYDRPVTLAETKAAVSNFDWDAFLTATGTASFDSLNQPMPEFFAELNAMLAEVSFEDWKAYLRWHLVSALATTLSDEFVAENFHFYGTVLSGTPELEPRWKRVLASTNGTMGEALGQLYVARTFGPQAKERAREMVARLSDVMGDRIARNDWMSDETKQQARTKLEGLGVKLGYPDEWRDWSELEIARDSYAANVMRGSREAYRRDIAKIGKPVDLNEWGMTPQTLNAYYHPIRNEIVFPAAILQPPFFSAQVDDPLNYGAIGAVIGHEITHGFDDSGSQFDAEGKLRNWWTDSDRTEFEARTTRLVEQYGAFEPLDGVFVNGELTLGENIADLGGLSIAYEAMQRANDGTADPMLGGMTREQRFFVAFGRLWRSKMRTEAMQLQVNTNPHSPALFRAIGPLRNMQEFADAFDVPVGPMSLPREARADIW